MAVQVAALVVMALISAMTSAMQVRQNNKVAEAQGEAAKDSARLDIQRLLTRGNEQNDQAAREKLEREIQGERERSRIQVAQGEAGVQGLSSLSVLNSALSAETFDIGTLEANRASGISQTRADMLATQAQAQGRINSANASMTGGALAGLKIAGSAAEGGYSGYQMGSAYKSNIKPTKTAIPKGQWI